MEPSQTNNRKSRKKIRGREPGAERLTLPEILCVGLPTICGAVLIAALGLITHNSIFWAVLALYLFIVLLVFAILIMKGIENAGAIDTSKKLKAPQKTEFDHTAYFRSSLDQHQKTEFDHAAYVQKILNQYQETDGKRILMDYVVAFNDGDRVGGYILSCTENEAVEIAIEEPHLAYERESEFQTSLIEKSFLEKASFESFRARYDYLQRYAKNLGLLPIDMRALWEALLIIFEIKSDMDSKADKQKRL